MATESYEPGSYSFVLYRHFPEFDHYPMAQSFGLIICIFASYLAIVLKIGPDFMKNRPPYKLKNTILIYNAIQVVLSAYFVYLTLIPICTAGLFPKTTVQVDDPKIREMMVYATYIYFLGKLSELLDTVFFVLRKKYNQVSFLHVYHHSSVIIGTWLMVFYAVNQTMVYAAFINSLVHVVMYLYYFLAALGPEYQKYLTWKRHITTFQLVQFTSMFLHQVVSLLVTKGEYTVLGLVYVLNSTVLFFVLFSRFYNQSYKKPKEAVGNGNGVPSESNGIKQH